MTPRTFWVLEDTSSYHERGIARSNGNGAPPIAIRLYRVRGSQHELIAETTYVPRSEGKGREFKVALALDLLRRARVRRGTVVAGARFAQGGALVRALAPSQLEYVLALPTSAIDHHSERTPVNGRRALVERLSQAKWKASSIAAPESKALYSIADLGRATYGGIRNLRCLALSTGGIADFRRGLIVGLTSLSRTLPSTEIAYLLGWSRWIRFASRRAGKTDRAAREPIAVATHGGLSSSANQVVRHLSPRVNLKIAHRQDERLAAVPIGLFDSDDALRGRLAKQRSRLNVVELFAGAGGMGLGFLLAQQQKAAYRILFSGEIDPVFANTLRINHEFLRSGRRIAGDDVPHETTAVDLRAPSVMDRVQSIAREYGGVDVVIGGPPCQGFSSANRNSWSSKNPNNKLVDTYLDYVIRLRPRVFIMENVQGILWTRRHDAIGRDSVAEHVASRLAAAGYRIFPKLLDAAWYGVPQHRNRFFLLGIHTDLGYTQEDFGEWGPFPKPTHGPQGSRPYVTVREAIEDLPRIENGALVEELSYKGAGSQPNRFLAQMRRWAPRRVVWDHVTSRHAEYVIERYGRIPSGGNWASISGMMTNYAAVERTHSNIYRRLVWDEPAITIGHYRKAMLVHPDQDRGLSLREASRLQSFPDWFRFAGSENGRQGGLTHKQQQLGNAVCPLVTKAVASFLLKL